MNGDDLVFRPSRRSRDEAEIREQFRALGAMPHMRSELRLLFTALGQETVETATILRLATDAVVALRDVERFVAGARP